MNQQIADKVSYSLGELGALIRATVNGDPEMRISGVGPLESAGPGQLSFMVDAKYRHLLSSCRASALIVPPDLQDIEQNLLVTGNPYLAMARAAQLFVPPMVWESGAHPTAFVADNVILGYGASAGALSCIGEGSSVGAGTRIEAGAFIGRNVWIGENCLIHPRAVILDGCSIGNRVIIHSGAVIGADGYGYAQDEQGRHVKIPQLGTVQIDDDVEIGANTTIDRATFGKTWIKRGAKIDNLVMLGHNVVVGEDSLLVAQVGISGSTRLGNNVVLGGQVGIAGHVQIGDRVKIGAKSGILHSIKPDQNVMGIPAVPYNDWFRTYANIQRLPRIKEELKRLREKMQVLEEALKGDDGHKSD